MSDPAAPSQDVAWWLRAARASVSRRSVSVAVIVLAGFASVGLIGLVAVPRAQRQLWVFNTLFDYLRTNPPTDDALSQLPPERLESVRVRGLALLARLLDPSIGAMAGLLGLVALAYALVARHLRPRLHALVVAPIDPSPRSRKPPLRLFWGLTTFAILAHVPYTLLSIRFDEDMQSLYAAKNWVAWANNITGWYNHVAALLTIRLSTALFGMNELSVRAPAILASSAALAFLCTFLWTRFSPWIGCITAGLLVASPMWVEQTGLARGYGLSFAAGAVLTVGMLRLDDEEANPTTSTMLCIFFGVFVGCLAHFFFVFLVAGVFAVVCFNKRLSSDLRIAILWWIALASIVPALSTAVGAPAVLVTMHTATRPSLLGIVEPFAYEMSFRHTGWIGFGLALAAGGIVIAAAVALPKRRRVPFLIVLATALGVPTLANPVYLYPRYFIYALAFVFPAVGWLVSVRLLRGRTVPNVIALLVIVGIWCSTRPWSLVPSVDLRSAAQVAREQDRQYGQRFAVDTYVATGVRFYNGTAGRIVNTTHPVPDDVDRILLAIPRDSSGTEIPANFHVAGRTPGSQHDVVVLARSGT